MRPANQTDHIMRTIMRLAHPVSLLGKNDASRLGKYNKKAQKDKDLTVAWCIHLKKEEKSKGDSLNIPQGKEKKTVFVLISRLVMASILFIRSCVIDDTTMVKNTDIRARMYGFSS